MSSHLLLLLLPHWAMLLLPLLLLPPLMMMMSCPGQPVLHAGSSGRLAMWASIQVLSC
jgi:hypothetical protein